MTRALPSAFRTVAKSLLSVAGTCALIGVFYGGVQGINGASVSQSTSSACACVSTILEVPRHVALREWGSDFGVVSLLNVLIPCARFWCGSFAGMGAAAGTLGVQVCGGLLNNATNSSFAPSSRQETSNGKIRVLSL